MKTIKFNIEESSYHSYEIEVSDEWKEGDNPFDGHINSYTPINGLSVVVGEPEGLEIKTISNEVSKKLSY